METNNSPQNKTEPTNITKNILAKIQMEKVSMRPKYYFVLKLIVLCIVAGFVLSISVFIFNFIFFSMRISGHETLLSFGSRGVLAFFILFPWGLLCADLVLILVLEWLLHQFRFAYRSPVLYLLLALLACSLSLAFVIDRETSVNDRLLHRADRQALPFFGVFYESARIIHHPENGLCRCVITAISGNTLSVYDRLSGTTTVFTVVMPPEIPNASELFKVGDSVFIGGDASDRTIRAFGVKKILETEDAF